MSDRRSLSVEELLIRDHRRLDDLFGRFLAAASAGDAASAGSAIREFDAALRRHTALEEEHLFPAPPGGRLVPATEESDRERLFRELRLEHVQVRELSGILARLFGDPPDPDRARGLAASLARRWDAHTAREEEAAYPFLSEILDRTGERTIREQLEQ